MVMLCVDIKLGLDFNHLPLKMQKRSFHVLLINKTRLNSTLNSSIIIYNIIRTVSSYSGHSNVGMFLV